MASAVQGAERVDSPEQLRPALDRALAAGRPACVNVTTDPSVISPMSIAKVGQPQPASGAGEREKVQIPYAADLE